jgi:hypothetical protein
MIFHTNLKGERLLGLYYPNSLKTFYHRVIIYVGK